MTNYLAPEHQTRITLWIQALESGEFEQGTGCLSHGFGDSRRYCCLGVAEEVRLRHDSVACQPRIIDDDDDQWTYGCDGEEADATLTNATVAWYGLPESDPMVNLPTDLTATDPLLPTHDVHLTTANDSIELKLNFSQIAAALRYTFLSDESSGGISK